MTPELVARAVAAAESWQQSSDWRRQRPISERRSCPGSTHRRADPTRIYRTVGTTHEPANPDGVGVR